jgi:PAS domain S-box-containing protein
MAAGRPSPNVETFRETDPYAPRESLERTEGAIETDRSRSTGAVTGTWVTQAETDAVSGSGPREVDEDDPFAALFRQLAKGRETDEGTTTPHPRPPVTDPDHLDMGGRLGEAFGFAGGRAGDITPDGAPEAAPEVHDGANGPASAYDGANGPASDGLAWLVGAESARPTETAPPEDMRPIAKPVAKAAPRSATKPTRRARPEVESTESAPAVAVPPPVIPTMPKPVAGPDPKPELEPVGMVIPPLDDRPAIEPTEEPGMALDADEEPDSLPPEGARTLPPEGVDPDPAHRAWLAEAARHIEGDDPDGADRAPERSAGAAVNAGARALEELRGALDGQGDFGDRDELSSRPGPLSAPDPDQARRMSLGATDDGDGRDPERGGSRLSEAVGKLRPEAPGVSHRWSVGARLGVLILLGLIALGVLAGVSILADRDAGLAADRLTQAAIAEGLVSLASASVDGAAAAVEGPDPSLAQPLLVNARRQLIDMAERGAAAGLPELQRGALDQAEAAETLAPRLDGLVADWTRTQGEGTTLAALRAADRALEEALADMPFGGSLAAQGTRLVALGRAYLLDGESDILATHAGVLDLFLATAEAAVLDEDRRDALAALARTQASALKAVAETRSTLAARSDALAGDLRALADAVATLAAQAAPARGALETLATQAREEGLKRMAMLAGGLGLGLLILGWLLTRTVTRPLNRLADALAGLSIDAAPALLPGLRRRDALGAIARAVQDHRLTSEEQAEYLRQHAQAAKAYLAAVLDGAPEALVTIDERGTIVGFNPMAEDIFGFPAPQVVGRSVSKLMPGGRDDDPETGRPWFRAQDEEETHNPVRQIKARRADGQIFPAELTVLEAKREIGGVLFVMFLRDLSEMEGRVREVERSKGLADEARATHGEFLNVLANELAYPVKGLNVALGEGRPDLARSEACLTLLNAITNDVRGFANLEGGLVDLNFAPVNLRQVCENARATIADMARDFGLDMTLSVEPDVPATVLGDEALVETVVANLLECAVQFNATDPSLHATQPGTVALTVRLVQRDAGPPRPRIEVGCDRKAVVRRSLDAKERGRAPLSPAARLRLEVGGARGRTGMILSITKRLVQLMRGEVGMESWPGQGTVLWFELDA